ncbi:AraC family transcriptional regulator [Spirosoma panaciterrae]|uniref:AraC family transcriptional regulator n=1 Tax=Spirosoma panaciterrae TaxID=496058 RepID=UPI00038001E6|nr:helix-turn-helix domain-containing protein [Spirosoma panaciterrae]
MHYQIIRPPEVLSEYIRYFWTMDYDGTHQPPKLIKILADPCPRLVFQHLSGNTAIAKGDGSALPTTFLRGVNSKVFIHHVTASFSVTGVSFQPHAIKTIFRVDAVELADAYHNLQDFAPNELQDRLLYAENHQERVNILINFFLKKLNQHTDSHMPFYKGISQVKNGNVDTRVQELLRYYSLSERSLERRFKQSIGVSPKLFLRINRFERALKHLKDRNPTRLTELSYLLNYADQSHFSRDFREFSGLTPNEYLRQQKLIEESSSFMSDQ